MPALGTRLKRSVAGVSRRVREWRMIARGVASTSHPVLAHIVPIRRCNLACTYCNEFDDFSKPVPVEEMLRRIDHLADLGTSIISFSGGEPLLHPELDDLIARIRRRGAMAGMITNGYLLTADRIQRLNRAGLEHMQISIDNVMPDDVSKKSLKVLDKKLQLLDEHAHFHVNINSVVGGGIHNPHDAVVVAKRAVELGFTSTVGIIHDHDGQLQPLSQVEQEIYLQVRDMGKKSYARMNYFQDNIAHGRRTSGNAAPAPATSTSAKRGWFTTVPSSAAIRRRPWPNIRWTDIRREFITQKGCAPRCTVACVHYTSYMDFWRAPQTIPAPPAAGQDNQKLVQLQTR